MGRVVLLAGEAGIGKTRLAHELAAIALAGGTSVARGRAASDVGAPPLWPWLDVLRSLGAPLPSLDVAEVAGPDDNFKLADLVVTTIIHAAGGGLLVLIDDAHLADGPSVVVVRLLADRAADVPLMILLTFRDDDRTTPLHRALPALASSPAVERVDLSPLDRQSVAAQLRAIAGDVDDDVVQTVVASTGGNPFFVEQLGRAIADGTWRRGEVPRSVLDVVTARATQLGAVSRRMVELGSVVGVDLDVTVLAEASGEDAATVVFSLDQAVGHGIIESVGAPGRYRFVHALARDAVLASLPSSQQLDAHHRVAQALVELHASDPADHLGALARHWSAVATTGRRDEALPWVERAADDALRRGAYDDAACLYGDAIRIAGSTDIDRRLKLLLGLGRAAVLAGEPDTAINAATEAADLAESRGDAASVGAAALLLEPGTNERINAEAADLCRRALAGLPPDRDQPLRARLAALQGHLAFYAGDLPAAEAHSADALKLARGCGDEAALVDALRARQEASPGPTGRAIRLALAGEMLDSARRTRNPRTEMWGRLWRIDAFVEVGDFTAATAELPPLEVATARVGGPVSAWLRERATACIAQGRAQFDVAEREGRRAYVRMKLIEPQAALGAYLALRCALSHHIGPSDESVALARAPIESPPWFHTMGRTGRAFLLARAGLLDEAMVQYRLAGPIDTWRFPPFAISSCIAIGALAATALSQDEDLVVLIDRLEEHRAQHLTTGAGVVNYLGPTELHLGAGALRLGRLDDAVRDLASALSIARTCATPGFAAEAGHRLATALVARNRPGDHERATLVAAESHALIGQLGLGAFAGASDALERQLSRRSGPPGLSAREAEVADLVADGFTNRQIAERLFISERTAANHVQRTLQKLGFTTRSQIAAWVMSRRRQ